MTLNEIQTCAYETLIFFLNIMPNVPFAENDIIIKFAKRRDMADQTKALCGKYVPGKYINESQARQLNESIAANALIGREKSAVIVCINLKLSKKQWRRIFFHEYMHIFCAKSEVDGEHFMDIYGNIHTPDMEPEDKIYDGNLNAGYNVWSEFIAEYFTQCKASDESYNYIDIADHVDNLLIKVSIMTDEQSKTSFAMACAYLLSCGDADEILNPDPADENPNPALYEKENKAALLNCLRFLYLHIQNDKPWKINEEFIEMLGSKYIWFKTTNSIYLSQGRIGDF
jgi:hypothetical protein